VQRMSEPNAPDQSSTIWQASFDMLAKSMD
jgi:hypothetical protein